MGTGVTFSHQDDDDWFEMQTVVVGSEVKEVAHGDKCSVCGPTCECWPLESDGSIKIAFTTNASFKATFLLVREKVKEGRDRNRDQAARMLLQRQSVGTHIVSGQRSVGRLAFVPVDILDAHLRTDVKRVPNVHTYMSQSPFTSQEVEGVYMSPWSIPANLPHWEVEFESGKQLRLADNTLPGDDVHREGQAGDFLVVAQRQLQQARPPACKGNAAIAPVTLQTIQAHVAKQQATLRAAEDQQRLQNEAVDVAAKSGQALASTGTIGTVTSMSRLTLGLLQGPPPRTSLAAGAAAVGKAPGGKNGKATNKAMSKVGKSAGKAKATGKAGFTVRGMSSATDGVVMQMAPGDIGAGSGTGSDEEEETSPGRINQGQGFDLIAIMGGQLPGHLERWAWSLVAIELPQLP